MSLCSSPLPQTFAGGLAVVLALSTPVALHAQSTIVSLDLPAARRQEMTEALQIALSSRVDVENSATSNAISEKDTGESTSSPFVLSVEFPSGQVAPGELVLRRRGETTAARARLTHAWDVVDPRTVGAVALSLVEWSLTEPRTSGMEEPWSSTEAPTGDVDESERAPIATAEPSTDETSAHTEPDRGSDSFARGSLDESLEASTEAGADDGAAIGTSEPRLLSCGLCSDFILHAGVSFTHGAQRTQGFRGELAFYGRLNGWASVGLRFSGGGGYSSSEGGLVDGVIGAPSVMVSHRIPFRSSGFGLELGVHTEAAIGLKLAGRNREDDAVEFGLGVGAFAAFELGRRHGVAIDYTFSTFGLGGRSVRNQGALSLVYTRRWGAP